VGEMTQTLYAHIKKIFFENLHHIHIIESHIGCYERLAERMIDTEKSESHPSKQF
jgi:hypothetical protein